LKDDLSLASKGQIKSYKAVKLLDLAPGVNLDFDVSMYMPANKKYIKLLQNTCSVRDTSVNKAREDAHRGP